MLLHDLGLLCFYVISSVSANCLYGTAWYESFDEGCNTHWTYTNGGSPVVWATLDPCFNNCAISTTQSPVNLDPSYIGPASIATMNMPPFYNATMKNSGHGIYVYPPNDINATTVYNGQTYQFLQIHFHTPSEHRLMEEYFLLEAHLVHQNTRKQSRSNHLLTKYLENNASFLVLGTFYELSPDLHNSTTLQPIVDNLPSIPNPGDTTQLPSIDIGVWAPYFQNPNYRKYGYTGSLTTPPCSDGVTFVILTDPYIIMSVPQFMAMKRFMKFNSRYTQNKPGDPNLLQIANGGGQHSIYEEKDTQLVFTVEEEY